MNNGWFMLASNNTDKHNSILDELQEMGAFWPKTFLSMAMQLFSFNWAEEKDTSA